VIVEDARMRRLYQLARSAAAGVINVLIVGETGRRQGRHGRGDPSHVAPREGAVPVAQLHGRVRRPAGERAVRDTKKGAFTGATEAKAGLLETAPGGTVFLDEIGDMPPSCRRSCCA
jgi:DNA-binding NtrC family response regulator